jgi:hypothetical protein
LTLSQHALRALWVEAPVAADFPEALDWNRFQQAIDSGTANMKMMRYFLN